MTILLSTLAILLSVLAIFAYQWVTPLPQLGIGVLYHLRWIRLGVAVVALGLAVTAWALHPSTDQFIVLLVTIALTPLSGANHAERFLPSLDYPKHISASESRLKGQSQVLAVEVNGAGCAWPLEILVPHHIIHDRVGGVPVMAVW